MPYAPSKGRDIFYEDTGGDKPAIIFSHGLLMDHRSRPCAIASVA